MTSKTLNSLFGSDAKTTELAALSRNDFLQQRVRGMSRGVHRQIAAIMGVTLPAGCSLDRSASILYHACVARGLAVGVAE